MSATAALAGDNMALMLGEANHRFFNGLQTIVAATNGILRREIGDPDLRDRLAALQDRVVQLADINRRLAGPFGPDSVSILALEALCFGLAASFDRGTASLMIDVHGQARSPDTCRIVLLLVSELMTNALKHSNPHDPLFVQISVALTTDRCLLIVSSNTSQLRGAGRPRVATELAEAVGGTLSADEDDGEYRVAVVLPTHDADLPPSSGPG